MILYILTSTLLSIMGLTVYLLVRQIASARQRKVFLYLVIGGSLLLPLAPQGPGETARGWLEPHSGILSFTILDPIQPAHLQHYCQCEDPTVSHRIMYRTHSAYNFLLEYKGWITALILLAMAWVLVRLMLRYGYLHKLVRKAAQHPRIVNGKPLVLLPSEKIKAPGAFQLKKAYLLWPSHFSQLEEQAQQAILHHEASHLWQHNTLEKALLDLLQCIWLLNPAFYAFRKELDLLSEFIADDAGAGVMGKKAYAHLLLSLKSGKDLPWVSAFLGNDLKARIQFLLKDSHSPSWTVPLATAMLVLGMQFMTAPALSAGIEHQLQEWQTYERIYYEHPEEECLIYCQDCESVCRVEE